MTGSAPPRRDADKMVELAFTIFLLVVSALFIWYAQRVPDPPRNIVVGPRTFPTIVGWIMLVLSGLLVWRAISGRGEPEAAVPLEDDERAISDWPAVYIVLGSLLVLFLVIEMLGFVVALASFVFVLSTIFSPDKWIRNAIVSVVFSTAIYYVFVRGLGIMLPAGLLRGIL